MPKILLVFNGLICFSCYGWRLSADFRVPMLQIACTVPKSTLSAKTEQICCWHVLVCFFKMCRLLFTVRRGRYGSTWNFHIRKKKKSDALIYWEGWAPFPLLHHSLNIRTVACNRLGLYWLLVYLYIARALTFSKPLTLHQVYLYINYVWSVQATLHIRYILSKSFYLNRQHCR